ncbi:acyltransferase family protein [Actinorugispora endophytica]|uniref:Peptidoglycan/LPS O-acetylase OafA/YrhL n=1 Tax=Actinorugispora endophytica TaxID=1605990 RepID=A0A4R6UFB7_9ACTN|nr:acyltransferase family protein [Actinorugispora endophytica]TDQ45510.1 peptidoglycan/LPS O-acetylase OafA/YrhL [Actinorugispora endophytica]
MSLDAPAPAEAPTTPPPRRSDPPRFRPEVQGLRAVAVLLVVVYHLDEKLLPGGYVGVDVFFVISGFLITSLLIREVRSRGAVSLGRFYVRRVRRILPAATLVLVATAVATAVLLPATRWEQTAVELAASAAYAENLVLAGQTVDYLAAEEAPSPVQHFWSLAVEEQFYLLWPLLFVGWAALRARAGRTRRTGAVLACAVGAVLAASFACSVLLTASEPTAAYFLPHTRVWELAAGGALAAALTRWEVPRVLRAPLGWTGLAAIGAAAFSYGAGTAFPGTAAALPVLGAAAVIAAGRGPGRLSAGRLLGTGPARFVGDISYALYLWHWPLMVITLGMLNETGFDPVPLSGALVLAASFLLAWGTRIAVEDPVRERGLLDTGRSAAVFALVGVLVVAGAGGALHVRAQQALTTPFDPSVHVGPEALASGEPTQTEVVDPLYPSVVGAEDDLPDLYSDGCQSTEAETAPSPCVYGSEDAGTTVAIVGDSHAAHWSPALQEVAEDRGWRLYTFTKSSCAFTTELLTRPNGDAYPQCQEWNENVVAELRELGPSIVFTSSRALALPHGVDDAVTGRERMAEGMVRLWTRLEESGIRVVALRDTPKTRARVVECIDLHARALDPCAQDRDNALEAADPQVLAASRPGNDALVIDLSDRFCAEDVCPAVVGNVIVYRDSHHLTATYSRLLGDDLGSRIDAAL